MNRYELKEELGDGSFGRVMKATLKETGDVVAIKHIKRKFKSWKTCVDLREVQSLRNMSHPNIVPIKEVIRESDESLYFVFEYMSGGSLYELTKACMQDRKAGKPQRLTKELVSSFMRQMLKGIAYIHRHGYVHRDIKPENILVDGHTLKLADFGLARELARSGSKDITFYVSTRWYRAPEVILHCPSYGKPVDVFATGLILAELITLQPLFPGSSEIDQINKMVRVLGPPSERSWDEGVKVMKRMNFRLWDSSPNGQSHDNSTQSENAESVIKKTLPSETLPVVSRFIRELIEWNPSSRPDAEDAIKHEYFQSALPGNIKKKSVPNKKKGSFRNQDHLQAKSIEMKSDQSWYQPRSRAEDAIKHNDSRSATALRNVEKNSSTNENNAIYRKQRHLNADNTEMSVCKERYRHRTSEIGTKKSITPARKSKAHLPITKQPRNEFCQYLEAFSKEDTRRSEKCKPGNRIRSIMPGRAHVAERKMASSYQQSWDAMPTPSARRNHIARTKNNTGINGKKTSRKSRKKPKTHSRPSFHGRGVEVCISRPASIAVDESFNIMPQESKPDSSENPFNLFGD